MATPEVRNTCIAVMAHVHLDSPLVLERLRRTLLGYYAYDAMPAAFVLIGAWWRAAARGRRAQARGETLNDVGSPSLIPPTHQPDRPRPQASLRARPSAIARATGRRFSATLTRSRRC